MARIEQCTSVVEGVGQGKKVDLDCPIRRRVVSEGSEDQKNVPAVELSKEEKPQLHPPNGLGRSNERTTLTSEMTGWPGRTDRSKKKHQSSESDSTIKSSLGLKIIRRLKN